MQSWGLYGLGNIRGGDLKSSVRSTESRVKGKGRHLGKYAEPLDEKIDSTVMPVR